MTIRRILTIVGKYTSISLKLSTALAVFWFMSWFWSVWNGFCVFLAWIVFQGLLAEVTVKYFQYNYHETDSLDVTLAVIIVLVLSVASSSLCLDLVHENAQSNVFIAKSIFNSDICDQVISIAENHASNHGWLTKRHKNYPTTDLAVSTIQQNISISPSSSIESVRQVDFSLWVNETIKEKVFPRLVSYYALSSSNLLSMQDIFIVKYDGVTPGAQRHLQMHMDSSLLSFNIALSEHSSSSSSSNEGNNGTPQFQGGGTHFSLSDDVIQLERGSMLVHPSRIYHEGVAVTGGVRYILVGFVKVDQWNWNTVWRRFGTFTKCLSVYNEIDEQQQLQRVHSGSDPLSEYELTSTVCQSWFYPYFYSASTLLSDIVNKDDSSTESLLMKGLLILIVVAVLLLIVLCISMCHNRDIKDFDDFDDSKYDIVFMNRLSADAQSTNSGSVLDFCSSKVLSKEA